MMVFSQNEIFLKNFHAQLPGCTSQTMASHRTSAEKSSYELLADLVPTDSKSLTVLDLACGDGYLLSLLESRNQTGLELHGIDTSESELGAAKKRLSQIGDSRLNRTRTGEGVQSIFKSTFSEPVQIKDFLLTAYEPLNDATTFFMSYYSPALLEESKKIKLENNLKAELTKLADPQGRIKCVECLPQIIVSS